MIYNINGNAIGGMYSLIVETDCGNLSVGEGSGAGEGYNTNTLVSAGTRFHSAFPIKVAPNSTVFVKPLKDELDVSAIRIFEFDADFAMIQRRTLENGSMVLTSSTEYIKILVAFDTEGYNPSGLLVTSSDFIRVIKNPKIRTTYEQFVYEVYDGIYSSAALLLPPNYDPDGKPVPLLVYAHGAGGYAEWNTGMGVLLSGNTYFPFMEYLRDEGYAVLDCFGWTSKYIDSISGATSNTFGTRICNDAYVAGVKHVLSRYNLDENNVSLYCKSLGGQIAGKMITQSIIPIKAVAMLAPSIDMLNAGDLGYNVPNRVILAQELELEGDVENVFLQENFTNRSESGRAFLNLNKNKFNGLNPGWLYSGRTLDEKFDDSMDYDFTYATMYRDILYPVKIWCAPDDTQISYPKIQEYIAQCQNSSYDASLRLMPEGTGGHHSVDNDPNALKDDITTALGIAHTNVPLAYIEMVEFFRSRQ